MSETKLIPKVGDFAVVQRRYSWPVVHISKVTAKQIRASREWSSRDHTYYIDDILFCGKEAQARLLAERLKSSEALYSQEINNAHSRMIDRNKRLIAEATP